MILIAQPLTFKWQSHFFIKLYRFFDFLCMHVPILVTTTHPGLPSPPYSIGTPPTHLLALSHHHSSSTSPTATSTSTSIHTHIHLFVITIHLPHQFSTSRLFPP